MGTAALGARCYIAVAGGFDAPLYLGSRATFPSGNLGGYQGRPLAVGDSCELGLPSASQAGVGVVVPEAWRPALGEEEGDGRVWRVTMLQGPQTAPDYFTEEDMKVRPLHCAEFNPARGNGGRTMTLFSACPDTARVCHFLFGCKEARGLFM